MKKWINSRFGTWPPLDAKRHPVHALGSKRIVLDALMPKLWDLTRLRDKRCPAARLLAKRRCVQ